MLPVFLLCTFGPDYVPGTTYYECVGNAVHGRKCKCHLRHILLHVETKRYGTTLWLVHQGFVFIVTCNECNESSQQHGAKENVCTPLTETNVAPLCSQDVEIQQKGVSRHYLTPESGEDNTPLSCCRILLFRNIYLYDIMCSGTIYENDTYGLYV